MLLPACSLQQVLPLRHLDHVVGKNQGSVVGCQVPLPTSMPPKATILSCDSVSIFWKMMTPELICKLGSQTCLTPCYYL